MGFWSWLTDDVLGIDPPGPPPPDNSAAIQQSLDQQTAALKKSNAIAQAAADTALTAQKAAIAKSEAALMPAIDSESVRSSQDNQRRKLQAASPFGIGLQKKLGAAPTGFRVLSGS
ncbi:hypothetical protein ASC80_01715 [Afipia sp. Root123D2]|uniref:hypothetical protein n=1 Tax=Afipia sp. Root123D2 TaxID=1736436 RepID=UPI0006F5643D|nr:hypothetical protein [Afipia sp. Root123D2]KQW22140.1 hypothetical protein ASC80_01715 [Afipia sp. Root123D2]